MPSNHLNDLKSVLSSGCDERVFLSSETGRNKYNVNPLKYEGIHFRGSCTCGSLTPFTQRTAEQSLERLREDAIDYDAWSEEQRLRIKSLIQTDDDFDIFFAPSGSDLVYFPILFQRILSPKPIVNILSCPEELGSGSLLASQGKYYSAYSPFGDAVRSGELISDELVTEVVQLPARSDTGTILNRAEHIRELISKSKNKSIITNLVFGSKSGIKDDLNVIDSSLPSMWTVDLCQFRADGDLIGNLLDQGALVLITGSKFYNAPPFCGAVLVPKAISDALEKKDALCFASMKNTLAKSDIPIRFSNMREQLIHANNDGLRLRWECALPEMEAFAKWPRQEAIQAMQDWNTRVVARLESSSLFELMPDQKLTNTSIISFRVKWEDSYLDHSQLAQLFRVFTQSSFGAEFSFDSVFIGQPVKYGEKSFLRFALGSWAVRQVLAGLCTWDADLEMIDALEKTIYQKSWN